MKILIVEDDERLASIVRAALVSRGHIVDAEGDGVTGLMLAKDEP